MDQGRECPAVRVRTEEDGREERAVDKKRRRQEKIQRRRGRDGRKKKNVTINFSRFESRRFSRYCEVSENSPRRWATCTISCRVRESEYVAESSEQNLSRA